MRQGVDELGLWDFVQYDDVNQLKLRTSKPTYSELRHSHSVFSLEVLVRTLS